MASNSITIDHHNLRRNLNLNDKYISNDGGDEGIRITDAGLVGIGVTDPDSSLEIMSTGNILKLSRDADDYLLFTQQDSGGDAILESTGGFQFKIAAGDNLTFYEGGNQKFLLGLSGTTTKFRMSYSVGDYFLIETDNNGVTTMSTVQDSVADANLTLDVDGDLILDPDSGITKFYLAGDADDLCTLTVAANGATTIATTDSDGAVGHLNIEADGHVEFDNCAVGFDKETTTFAASDVLSEGDDSTDIDFRLGNKHELTLTDNIAGSGEYINMIFPATSGNFILVLIQGVADCTVHSTGWRAYQSDGSTLGINELAQNGTDGRVRWAGGTAPTLSTSQYDIDVVSFYWDADNGTALGVASLDFS